MNILLALIPISLILLALAVGAFIWAVRRGQFDDLETPALDILRNVLSSPQFQLEVIEREKARSIVAIKESLTRPATIAGNAFWSAMYPAHPYGRQPTVESIASLERADLEGFYRANYSARRAVVTIVGDV